MASAKSTTLAALLQRSTIVDDEKILQATSADPKSSQNDPQLLHTRIVALLKLDRFDDALRTLESGPEELGDRCLLERAYALYKLGRLSESAKIVDGHGPKSRGLKHVAAQVSYRGEKFQKAAKLYDELSQEPAIIVGEENDLRINITAVGAQLWWQGHRDTEASKRTEKRADDLEAFETTFNLACSCIARREFAEASMLLKRARDLCEASEDLNDEEKEAEVLPIMVQQAFVFAKLGNLEAKESLQRMISVNDVPEPPTRAIALNNALALSPELENPFMTARIFGQAPQLLNTEQHFKHQVETLHRNMFVLHMQSQKYHGVALSTSSCLTKTVAPTLSSNINGISALNVAAYAQGAAGRIGVNRALYLLDKRPNDLGLLLTTIQLHTATNNHTSALGILEAYFKRLEVSGSTSDQEVRFAPGLVALAISLNKVLGRNSSARTELAKAASFWQANSKACSELLHAAGIALLKPTTPSDLQVAGEIYSNMRSQNPGDVVAVAGYVAAFASKNSFEISSDLEKLKSVSSLVAGIDTDALEGGGIPPSVNRSVIAINKKRKTDPEKATVVKKRKLSKARMPKQYEPGKQMDPERWLPLRDRSTYRPRRRKGKKKANDLTQGGIVKEEESLELAGGAGTVKVEKLGGGGVKPKKKKAKK